MKKPVSTTELKRKTQPVARQLLKIFPEIATDARLKKRVLSAIGLQMPPYPGRPRDPRWDNAERMRNQGHPWKKIASMVFENFDRMPKGEQQRCISLTGSSVRARRSARRRGATKR